MYIKSHYTINKIFERVALYKKILKIHSYLTNLKIFLYEPLNQLKTKTNFSQSILMKGSMCVLMKVFTLFPKEDEKGEEL